MRGSSAVVPGTIPVREGEGFDSARVLSFLRERIPEIPPGEMDVRQFPTGASNLTYWIRVGDWEAVLRRPPLGSVPPKAHDMEREGRLLARLHPVFPLAPEPYLVSSDPTLFGAPFHVMEYRRGVVIDADPPDGLDLSPERCRRLGEQIVTTLAELHLIDYQGAGLGDVGRPEGFLRRQVEGWIGRYERARTDQIPEADPLMAWLRETVPDSDRAAIIHNDFKLNNLLIDPRRLEITGVLDWEMATIGDPIFDLSIFLSYWQEPGDPPAMRSILRGVTVREGFPTREELARLYAARTGRDLPRLDWYLTFAYFKLAVILQQIYARWVRGQTRDERFARFGESVRTLIEQAHSRIPRG